LIAKYLVLLILIPAGSLVLPLFAIAPNKIFASSTATDLVFSGSSSLGISKLYVGRAANPVDEAQTTPSNPMMCASEQTPSYNK